VTTTIDSETILDRIRAICEGPPFDLVESVSWVSFELQPATNIDGVYRIPPPSSQATLPRFDMSEERTESVQIWVSRRINSDYDAVRRRLLQDRDGLIAAICRDAFLVSGEYNVPGDGRGYVITPERLDTAYVSLRLTLAINYDISLR
jgi:hypothetical protein